MTYLDTWQSTISKAQSDWISQLLHRLGQESSLSTAELKEELHRLTQLLLAGDTKTLSQLFPAVTDELIDAEGHNLMLEGLVGDLTAAFSEALNLGKLQQAYQQLYEQRIITELRSALGRLEADIQRLSYLGHNTLGFTHALHHNFSLQSYRTPRTHPLANLLYRDPRLNRRLTSSQDCVVDDQANSLTLPLTYRQMHRIESVNLISRQLAGGLGGQELPGTRLEHLIDREPHTYWIYQEATLQPAPEGLRIRLQFDLGSFMPFSLIEIQPIADFPFRLTELSYESSPGHLVSLLSEVDPAALANPLCQPLQLHFNPRYGRRLYIGLAQESFQRRLSSELTAATSQSLWPYGAPTPTPAPSLETEVCVYTLGFDNILIGAAAYQPVGIYVSPMLEVNRCVLVGLDAQESISSRHTAVEYWVVKRDLDRRGSVLQTQVVPILPLNQRLITGESLVLFTSQGNYTNDTGLLRFCAHQGGELLDFQIYEEDRPLTTLEYRWLDSLTSRSPARLQLLNPGSNLYYSVDYLPAHLTTTTAHYLTSNQTIWLAGTNALHCALTVDGREIHTSQLFLVVLLRNNPRHARLTPQVRQCQLLAASAGE